MRTTSQHGVKSLTLLAALLSLQHAMAEDAWKPAAALITKDQETILKKVSTNRGNVIKVDYAVPAPRFEINPDQAYRGESTERCLLGNAWLHGEPGEPLLPYITARIILPYGHAVKGVPVVPTDSRRVEGSHLLSFGETPVPLSSQTVTRRPAKESVYESAEVYPGDKKLSATLDAMEAAEESYSLVIVTNKASIDVTTTLNLDDYEAELFIGRASAQDATEFANFICKAIAFETSDLNASYPESGAGGWREIG